MEASRSSDAIRLKRSKSELRLCCSLAMSVQERFFDYCGLDLDMWKARTRSLSKRGKFSWHTLAATEERQRWVLGAQRVFRHSDEGLFQEELAEQMPTGVSIIERNARVIKWLYGCRNAVQEGPKESTVWLLRYWNPRLSGDVFQSGKLCCIYLHEKLY